MKIEPADLIEECSENLAIRLDHWRFDHVDASKEELDIICKFVKWCLEEDQKDLDAPRNPDGKSFRQRREENRK